MSPGWWWHGARAFLTPGEQLFGHLVFAAGGFALGFIPERLERVRALEQAPVQFEPRALEAQSAIEDRVRGLEDLLHDVEHAVEDLAELAPRDRQLREARALLDELA